MSAPQVRLSTTGKKLHYFRETKAGKCIAYCGKRVRSGPVMIDPRLMPICEDCEKRAAGRATL